MSEQVPQDLYSGDKASATKPQSNDSVFIVSVHPASFDAEYYDAPLDIDHATCKQETKTALSEGDVRQENKNFIQCATHTLNQAVKVCLDNYVCLILLAAVGVALNVTCIKILSSHVSVFQIVAIRSGFCSVVLMCTCWWRGISLIEPRQKVPFLLLRGIFGAIAFFGLAMSTYALPLSISSFLANSYPVATSLMSWMFGMEDLGILSWSGVAGCFVGNALIAQPPFIFGGAHEEWDKTRIMGVIAGIASNIFMACTFVLIRHIGKSVPTIVLTTYMHLFCFFLSVPFLISGFPLPLNLSLSWLDLISYCATCLLGIALQLASTRALQIGPPTKVTSLYMTNMLLSCIVGFVVFSEKMSLISGMGAGIVLVSIMVVTAQNPKKKELQLPSTRKTVEELKPVNQSDSQA